MIYIDDNIMSLNLEDALCQLSEQRRKQALRFSHELGRRQCVASYLLLKEALLKEFAINENPLFDYTEQGKPIIRNYPHIHFNISHCRKAVAVAVGTSPVGIDIETIRPFKDHLARHVLNDSEYVSVVSSPQPNIEFIKLWTRKEALLKFTGEGIRRDLKTVIVNDNRIETIINQEKDYICSYILQ